MSLAKNRHERHLAAKAIGEVYYKMDNLNKTIVYLKQSIVEEPENSWTQGRLLQILAYHQRWDEAIEIGEGIMKTNPYGYAQKDLANAYAGKGSRFLSMAKIKRSDIDSLESKKLTSDAEALFLKGLKYDQSNFKCLSQLGFYYSEWAQRKQDTEMARKAISYMERAQKSPDAKSGEYSSLIAVLQKMASGGARTPANARGSGP